MAIYFLIDDGRNMVRWCEIAHDASGNGFWIDFKGRKIAWDDGQPLAHVEGEDIRCTLEDVPEPVAELEKKLAWERLVDPWSSQGWISPDGRFYGCRFYAHDDLAYSLLRRTPYALEQDGWVRVHSDTFRAEDDIRRVTSRQQRTLLALGFLSPEPGSGIGRQPYDPDRDAAPPRFAVRPPRGLAPQVSESSQALSGPEMLDRLVARLSAAPAFAQIFQGDYERVPNAGPGTWVWMLRFEGMDIGGEEHLAELLRSPGLHLRATSFDTVEVTAWPFEEIHVESEVVRLAGFVAVASSARVP